MKNMNVYTALEKRYAPPAWALFYEVGNATGNAVSRQRTRATGGGFAAAARQSLSEYQAAVRKFKEATEATAKTTPMHP